MPSGEVFTGPHESSATGRIRFTSRPSPAGVDVRGVELEFRDGEVCRPRAEHGEEYLQRALATDDGARRLGEVGIGTNYGIDRAIGAILFDEKIGGTVHVALGRSYPETGGKNAQRAALGPHLRPASRRADHRRRGDHPGGWALQVVGLRLAAAYGKPPPRRRSTHDATLRLQRHAREVELRSAVRCGQDREALGR